MKNSFLILFILVICLSCGQDPVPKPNAHLRLEFPEATYQDLDLQLPFTLERNQIATNVDTKQIQGPTESYGVTLQYPSLKGSIYLTYKSIDNKEENLIAFLRDAQKFTQEHTKKADEIVEQLYENNERRVYGMIYEVGGNAASQSQFYVTDSINHFLTGSLYFYAKPNYDSIYPAAKYLEKDIKHIMETVTWK
ncbi:gliding motility lipoprotein GldD [Xanthomarina spongicola]|jgi:gliding motility-associated lipoprotein GldD|uniref:Gliding motility-associated lipoprotein GldD n=1 Tax=Xanthomarina spongicola TaxID=570520 RepID=A0A316E7H6_9FLAO|nr:gliding motility lipoprotein GldD [Xanthomarina spongicola]PWK18920.1 gliding motility-associated lipoprotein GldD [Xanthomarina spongicola]